MKEKLQKCERVALERAFIILLNMCASPQRKALLHSYPALSLIFTWPGPASG
jgi:hypothetical protein